MDECYMQQALHVAGFARGRTSPNPMVGAVIVQEGKIVGQGWHRQAGTPHAEIHAINQAGHLAKGATLYVTLEPCSHYGRTGPCTEAIINAGIKRVVTAMTDPNPLVSGNGLKRLREAGIEVSVDVLAQEAAALNEVFIKWIATEMPFVTLKTAMSLDGKIAAHTGHSKWITSPTAREYVHRLRDEHDAILAGIGTVLADDPQLTARLSYKGKQPLRIIVDSKARIPLTAKVIQDKTASTVIAVTNEAPRERVKALQFAGVEVIETPNQDGRVHLRHLFKMLAARSITSILVEGGAQINASLVGDNLIDKICWFIAPKIIGGSAAPGPIGGIGIADMQEAHLLEDISTELIGPDILVSAYLESREGRNVYRTCGRIG